MGRRGPPPKPSKLKKAQGTYQKCRDKSAAVPQPAVGAPPVPRGMPAAAKVRWDEVAPQLLALGMLAEVDGGALEAYCRCYVQWRKLQTSAAAEPIVDTPFGPKVNPAGVEARKVHKEIVQPMELALGLHYAARSRMKAPAPKDDKDPVEEDLFGDDAGPRPPQLTAIAGGKAPDA